MLQRITHLLLVAALASSGATAPFLHVHAHGPGHGASSHGGAIDEHCAHHHAEGAHWHLPESRVPDAHGALGMPDPGHRHAAVTLSSAAVERSPVGVDAPAAPSDGPAAGALPGPRAAHQPVDPTAGPDPPPRALDAARAPPVRS